jgi:predicted nucleic acid-binding protein
MAAATFIADCSLTMSWCFADEQTARTRELLDRLNTEDVMVPRLWTLEVANVLFVAERRKRLTQAQTARFITLLRSLPIVVDDHPESLDFDRVLPLARSQNISSYDAVYLGLALRTGLPLATLDDGLAEAAKAVGVQTI